FMRSQLKDFVSTEKDIYRSLDALGMYTPPFSCCFNNSVKDGKLLAIGDEDGKIGVINTAANNTFETDNPRPQWQAHPNAIFDICWSRDDQYLASAAGDQTTRLWNVETQDIVAVFPGHGNTIKSVTNNWCDPSVYATGGRDGRIMVWDVRCTGMVSESGGEVLYLFYARVKAFVLTGVPENHMRPANTISAAHSVGRPQGRKLASIWGSQPQSVTAVKFLSCGNKIASSGAADGLIKFWDLRKYYSIKDRPTPCEVSSLIEGPKRLHGYSSFSLDSNGGRIYAACTDNNIYEFLTAHLALPPRRLPTAQNYRCSSFYIRTCVSPDDRFVASGSSDHGLYVWEIGARGRAPVVLKGHEGE
ncbi:hypothetical protein HK104_006863, partial [Borealophlyctis nickersoniae]